MAAVRSALVCVAALLLLGSAAQAYDLQQVQRLHHDLFSNYNMHTVPSSQTIVKFRMNIKHFDMIEETQALMVDSWIVNEWVDPRLRWDPEDYGHVFKISVPHTMLWKPDLDVYNNANVGKPISYGNTLLIVFHDGRVLFVPPVRLHFTCVMDLTFWPHDTHNCTLTIGSWIHDGITIDPQLMHDKPELDINELQTADGKNLTRGMWNLLDANITRNVKVYDCCPEPYIDIKVSMLVARNAPAYDWTVKLPAVGLCILTLVVFLLPPAAGEKVIFGGLSLILDVMFIAYTNMEISNSPTHIPLIVEMVCEQLMLVVASIVVASLTLRMARDPYTKGLHNVIKRPLIVVSYALCLHNYKNIVGFTRWEVSRAHQPYARTFKSDELELGENGTTHLYGGPEVTTSPGLDWLLLSAVVDRVCLIVYVAIFTINMLSFSAVL
ncbi:neuronal acetylcholine receptor subunit alpha-4-like isoform X1 [Penaeus monodon]|uniref:neuronal acetylcholine receptor subunit alpha-4-like isoform X1 n=1 Tax=Penaeus monodon TaxID=6687 RepID=UPI0018A6E512|nr:neuronal acetylcholine receptor subunit alpha-4-like isoform X1 [Penaeus monodon]